MDTNEFIDFIPSFFEKLKEDHMSQSVIDTNKWVINHFKNIVCKTISKKLICKLSRSFILNNMM